MAMWELRVQLERPGGDELGAPKYWEHEHLRPGSCVVMQEGEWAGEIGRVLGPARETQDGLDIVLTHRVEYTTRIVQISDTQPIPAPLFEVVEEMFGEMLTKQQDPEGTRLGTGKHGGYKRYYTKFLPEPPALQHWESPRIDMVAEKLQAFMALKPGQKCKKTQTCAAVPTSNFLEEDTRPSCVEKRQKHPWCEGVVL